LGSNSYFLTWAGPQPGENSLKGYEIRVDHEVVGFIDGFLFELDNINNSACAQISVAAIAEDDSIVDFKTVVHNRFSRNFSSCSSYRVTF